MKLALFDLDHTLSAADGSGTTTLNDIMIGDVFLCGGQSNMEFPLRLSTGQWSPGYLTPDPSIRFVMIQHESVPAPLSDLSKPAQWQVVGSPAAGDASAVCYYMSKAIAKDQKVTVGMIDSYWGGTTIQSWISAPTLRTLPGYAAGLDTLSLLARDPAKAMAAQSQKDEAWWDAHDPSNKANRAFIAAGYNDSKWPSLTADGGWKTKDIAALRDFDGVIWFRTTVTLTEDQAKTANGLLLGPIDTNDSTWVNGTPVGSSTMSWVWRDYSVAAGVFKAGSNSIVVRTLGGGGFTGSPVNRGVKTSDGQVIPLPAVWKYKVGMAAKGWKMTPPPWAIPTSLTTLYNGMIAPAAPYTLKGVAWYQGESNADAASEYKSLLSALMTDWRARFEAPNLPFLVAQLSAYGPATAAPGHSDWGALRDAQRRAVADDGNAGLAITIDVGDRTDVHPTEKSTVGLRLARAAQSVVYHEPVSAGGPRPVSVTRAGTDLVVKFADTNGGLVTYSAATAIGFEVCTAAETCTYATAKTDGDNIILTGANTASATKVRYAWADSPFVNLYSRDDLPAVPFEMEIGQ